MLNKEYLCEQRYNFSCGPASLKMAWEILLSSLKISEDEIICEMGGYNPDGYGWEKMKANAAFHKIESQLHKEASWNALRRCPDVVIVCYNTFRFPEPGAHYSLRHEMDGKFITLADPSSADLVKYSKRLFMSMWYDEEGKRNFLSLRKPVSVNNATIATNPKPPQTT